MRNTFLGMLGAGVVVLAVIIIAEAAGGHYSW